MYAQRNYILENEDIHAVVENMFERVMNNVVQENTTHDGKKEIVDYEAIVTKLKALGAHVRIEKINTLTGEELVKALKDKTFKDYNDKIEPVKSQVLPVEKEMCLRVMDRAWIGHIDIMSKLREGIHLRSYAQNNPLQAYVEEGFELFETMMNSISNDVVMFCNNVRVVLKDKK